MTPPFVAGRVAVRVPATSANLGPGFDALGLALELHDDVSARVIDEGLVVDVRGHGGDPAIEGAEIGSDQPVLVARDETHLVVRAMRAAFTELGRTPSGLELACVNRVPHSRGLGSSAAAIVAGVLLARELTVDGAERMPDDRVLALASRLEGHPDNVAPCLLGGLTVAWTERGDDEIVARAVRRDPDPTVVPVALIPPFTASTELARGLLPATVPHADAAFAAGRAALLIAALTGNPEALFAATEDRLHQRYRHPAMPVSVDLVDRLRLAGLPAVVSGAGPSVLVLARGRHEAETVTRSVPVDWTVRLLAVDRVGARTVRPDDVGPGASSPT